MIMSRVPILLKIVKLTQLSFNNKFLRKKEHAQWCYMMVSFRVAVASTAIGFSWHTYCLFVDQVQTIACPTCKILEVLISKVFGLAEPLTTIAIDLGLAEDLCILKLQLMIARHTQAVRAL
jgi:hypothetical protein